MQNFVVIKMQIFSAYWAILLKYEHKITKKKYLITLLHMLLGQYLFIVHVCYF